MATPFHVSRIKCLHLVRKDLPYGSKFAACFNEFCKKKTADSKNISHRSVEQSAMGVDLPGTVVNFYHENSHSRDFQYFHGIFGA